MKTNSALRTKVFIVWYVHASHIDEGHVRAILRARAIYANCMFWHRCQSINEDLFLANEN